MAVVGKEWAFAAMIAVLTVYGASVMPGLGQTSPRTGDPEGKDQANNARPSSPAIDPKGIRIYPRSDTAKGNRVRVLPIPADMPHRRVTFTPDEGLSDERSAAGTTDCSGVEVYRNSLGEMYLAPGPDVRIADDIQVSCSAMGPLTCFEFTVFGGGDGTGPGFGLDIALYDGCPSSGGQQIPGTSQHMDLADDGMWTVTLDLSSAPVAAPDELWLATFNYTSADAGVAPGWVFGRPPEIGASEDNFDYPTFPCDSWFGGWPEFPHGSFNARAFAMSCLGTHVAYLSETFSGEFHGGAANELSADDILPVSPACNLVELRLDYAGTAGAFTAQIDIREDAAGEPGTVISGTTRVYNGLGNGTLEQPVFDFDPPVSLPAQFWVTNMDDSADAGPVVAGGPAAIGHSDDSFAVFDGSEWDFAFFGGCDDGSEPCGSFNMRIICEGDAPAGACCDVLAAQDCTDDVPLASCLGRFVPGQTCASAAFDPPCGAAACCLSNGTCADLLESECTAGAGLWQPGEFCGEGSQACPLGACINATGSCAEVHATPGCDQPLCCDLVCQDDIFCCVSEWDQNCVDAALSLDICPGGSSPDNDDFDNALVITAGQTAFTTIGASTDGSDYGGDPDCGEFGDDNIYQDVWFDYTAPCTGAVTFTTCSDLGGNADFDTRLAVHDGCDSAASVPIGCNDDDLTNPCGGAPDYQSTLSVLVAPGTCYKVRVGGFQSGNFGDGVLNVVEDFFACGCPTANIMMVDPPAGVVDARQPSDRNDASDLRGIDHLVVLADATVTNTACWTLCETADGGDPNGIAAVEDNSDGTYTVVLNRPLTAGAVSTLSYDGGDALGQLFVHPGNVNGDSGAAPQDILAMIDFLNGAANLPWGVYSGDVDHSGAINAQDIIGVIDLLNGANAFESWNGSTLPDAGGCP